MAISLFNTYYDKSMGNLTNEILASGQIANGKYVALFSEGFAKKLVIVISLRLII